MNRKLLLTTSIVTLATLATNVSARVIERDPFIVENPMADKVAYWENKTSDFWGNKISDFGLFDQSNSLKKNDLIVDSADNIALDTSKTADKPKTAKTVKTKDWGQKFEAVSSLFGQVSQDRSDLQDLRERHMETYRQIRDETNPDFAGLAKDITKDTIAYVKDRADRIIEEMGPAPCEFSIFSLGSMPRGESCFYTDLEIGILMKKNTVEARRYFTKFTQRLSDQLFLLGEHPDVGGKGLRIDEADNAPMHMRWFARWSDPSQARGIMANALQNRQHGERMLLPYEGSRIFLTTPAQMARYSDTSYDWAKPRFSREEQKNYERRLFKREFRKALKNPAYKGLSRTEIARDVSRWVKDKAQSFSNREINQIKNTASLLRNSMSIYGSDQLFESYTQKRDRILEKKATEDHELFSNLREELAVKKLLGDMKKILADDSHVFLTGKLTDDIDLKRQFYRFPEQLLTNLGFYFNVGVQNTQDIADALYEKGVFSKEMSTFLKSWMNYATGLRMKQQEAARKQGFAIPATMEEYNDKIEDLENDIQNQNKVIEFLKTTKLTPADLLKEQEKLAELETKLKTAKKQIPQKTDSILSPDELNKLQSILPDCQDMFQRVLLWLHGDQNAFNS